MIQSHRWYFNKTKLLVVENRASCCPVHFLSHGNHLDDHGDDSGYSYITFS